MFRAYIDPVSGMRAIDAGCGRGHMTAHLAGWGLTVVGYDFSTVAVEDAKASHLGFGDLLSFRLHNFDADPIPPELVPGSVDVVMCRHSFEFLEQARFVNDVRRWLAPEGVLHITTHIAERMPPTAEHQGLSEKRIELLRKGWRSLTTYNLDERGSIVGIVLRGPRR
jgi:2-polyprenyl-3-methyl-5-hydroxy-6-metoxy-1,4-benzoquinol methylase